MKNSKIDEPRALKKLRYIFTPYQKRQLLILAILLFMGMIFEMVGLGVLIPALSIILNPEIGKEYPSLKPLLEFLGNPSQLQLVYYGMSLMIFVYILKTFFLIYLGWRQSKFSSSLGASLNSQLFQGYLYQPYSFHLQRNSSELIRNIQNEINQFTSLSQSIILLTTELSVVIGSAMMLVIIEPIGALTISLFLFTSALLFHRLTKHKLLRWGESRQFYDGQITKHLMQGLGAVKDVKIYGKEDYFVFKFDVDNKSRAAIFTKQVTLQQIPRLYLELLSIIGLAILIIMMVAQHKPINEVLPILGVFVAAAFRMIPSVNRIMGAFQNVRFTKPVVNTLYSEFQIIRNSSHSLRSTDKLDFTTKIVINKLSFSYANTSKKAIDDISIMINKGESIGLIGPSGSGKSTLIDLILGLLTPNSGTIDVDGINIQNAFRKWQNQIGYVPQTIYLTDDSILRNIAFGIPDTEINKVAVNKALKAAQLTDFVESLPEGLNTFVGERGVRLSGGQRQRIGIARALYHDPAILVLDEATSALDSNTEIEVMKAVSALHGEKTILIVAHRLSTVEKCDRLYRLEKGKVIQVGKPLAIL